MGKLSTHILDATNGVPAAKVHIELFSISDSGRRSMGEFITNDDGRTNSPLLEGGDLIVGVYELEFHIGDYFRAKGSLPDPAFLDVVPIRFGVADASANYHVPLLASPFSYSTYRGS